MFADWKEVRSLYWFHKITFSLPLCLHSSLTDLCSDSGLQRGSLYYLQRRRRQQHALHDKRRKQKCSRCSSSIAAKKSVNAFVVSAFCVSFEDGLPGAAAATEVDDACVGSTSLDHSNTLPKPLRERPDPARKTVSGASNKSWGQYVFQTWDGYIKVVLKVLCHAERLDCVLCLSGINMRHRHLEVMLNILGVRKRGIWDTVGENGCRVGDSSAVWWEEGSSVVKHVDERETHLDDA
ncbi:hypothetical protein BJV78DRAFT_1158085 [Lactifluus subvellereus]|nr:hypothetical protein BJV78DRAFT_1158085 [Lactifluus subvellereus]